jgi:hypothetical protein
LDVVVLRLLKLGIYIAIRFFWAHDRMKAGKIAVEHKASAEMLGDPLTKPLQGQLFLNMRRALLNTDGHEFADDDV